MKSFASAVVLVTSAAVLIGGQLCGAQPIPMHTPTTPPYTSTVGAHARYSKARVNMGQPNLALMSAVVTAGGGATSFDANKLVAALTAKGPLAQTETAVLTKKYGAEKIASFVKTFGFAVTDALAQATTAGIALPATPVPDPSDARAFAQALYAAGVPPRGGFDVEYMLDSLVSHVIHVGVMNDIDADPEFGPSADANYHAVLAQLMSDLKSADELGSTNKVGSTDEHGSTDELGSTGKVWSADKLETTDNQR